MNSKATPFCGRISFKFISILCLTENPCLGEKLPICKAQKILKPECTVVHEASFIIWQDFAATPQMGEFSFKH